MSKRQEAKYKIDRRLGVNLWGRAKSPVNKREYGPGQHGQRRKKPSDFGLQLMAKQKLKGYYGNIGEKQFRKLYQEAVRRKGDSGENLIQLLERRLDAVVYRMKFAPTPFSSRQIINHGHILVNGKRVNIPSYQVKDNDVVEVRAKAKNFAIIMESSPVERARLPGLRDRRYRQLQGHLSARPEPDRRAVPDPDGTESGCGILFALIMTWWPFRCCASEGPPHDTHNDGKPSGPFTGAGFFVCRRRRRQGRCHC